MTADEKQKALEGLREALADTTEKCSKAVARFDHANHAYRYLHRALSSVHIHEHINLMSPTSAKTLLKLSARYLIKARHPDCSEILVMLHVTLKIDWTVSPLQRLIFTKSSKHYASTIHKRRLSTR
jgi:hypothetical protein